jgi:hypothetical protein
MGDATSASTKEQLVPKLCRRADLRVDDGHPMRFTPFQPCELAAVVPSWLNSGLSEVMAHGAGGDAIPTSLKDFLDR